MIADSGKNITSKMTLPIPVNRNQGILTTLSPDISTCFQIVSCRQTFILFHLELFYKFIELNNRSCLTNLFLALLLDVLALVAGERSISVENYIKACFRHENT